MAASPWGRAAAEPSCLPWRPTVSPPTRSSSTNGGAGGFAASPPASVVVSVPAFSGGGPSAGWAPSPDSPWGPPGARGLARPWPRAPARRGEVRSTWLSLGRGMPPAAGQAGPSRCSSVPWRAGRIPIGIAGAVWSCRGALAVRPSKRPWPGTTTRSSSGHSTQRLPLRVPRRRRTMPIPAPNPRRSANWCPAACGLVRRVAASCVRQGNRSVSRARSVARLSRPPLGRPLNDPARPRSTLSSRATPGTGHARAEWVPRMSRGDRASPKGPAVSRRPGRDRPGGALWHEKPLRRRGNGRSAPGIVPSMRAACHRVRFDRRPAAVDRLRSGAFETGYMVGRGAPRSRPEPGLRRTAGPGCSAAAHRDEVGDQGAAPVETKGSGIPVPA